MTNSLCLDPWLLQNIECPLNFNVGLPWHSFSMNRLPFGHSQKYEPSVFEHLAFSGHCVFSEAHSSTSIIHTLTQKVINDTGARVVKKFPTNTLAGRSHVYVTFFTLACIRSICVSTCSSRTNIDLSKATFIDIYIRQVTVTSLQLTKLGMKSPSCINE